MLLIIVGLLALLGFTGPASADPIVTPLVVSLLGTTLAGTTIVGTLTVGALVSSIIVTGALVGVSLLMAKRPKLPEPQDGKILVKSAAPDKQWGVGTSRQVGALIASEMAGSTSYDVTAVHSGRISRFVRFYVGEDVVEFAESSTGPAIPNPGPGFVRLPGSYKGRYMGDDLSERDLYIDWRLGLPIETAYAKMVEALPGVWTENHRGDGVATILAIAKTPKDKAFQRRFPNGLPRVSAVGDWTIAWDPRDPEQIRTDPATWKFSDNPFVLLLDFYVHHEAGFHRPVASVYEPTSEYWIAAMDVCDELVLKADGGFEKRYTASGRFDASTPRKSVVEAYCRCCDGYVEEVGGGAIVVYAGKFYPSNFTLTDLDIIDDSVVFNKNDNEAINTINVKVVSEEHDYNEVEADAMVNQRRAPRKAADVNAEFSSKWRQSRRLAKIELSRQTTLARGTALVNLAGENLKGRRFFRLDLPERGSKLSGVWAEKMKLEDRVATEGGWYLEYELVDPARYDWDTSEEGEPPQIAIETEDDDLPVPNLPTLSVIRQSGGGGSITLISATNPPVTGWPDLSLVGRYQRDGETTWQTMTAPDSDLQVLSGPVTDGLYHVETAYVGGGGGQGDWSPPASLTIVADTAAPAAPDIFVTVSTGISFAATASNSANVRTIEVRRGTTAQAFAAATIIRTLNVSPNQTVSGTDAPSVGEWRYWAENYNGSGVGSGAPVFMDVTVV